MKKILKRVAILGVLLFTLFATIEIIGYFLVENLIDDIRQWEAVPSTIRPALDDETGYMTFVTEEDLKVLQLTDLHIGGGVLSIGKDRKAVEAAYELIARTEPDLVVLTGDIAYVVPIFTGTLNNELGARIVGELMEQCEVNWTFVFGNHDYESFSKYTQEEISDVYQEDAWQYCLYQEGPEAVDGLGNYVINVANEAGVIRHSMYLMDSHSYLPSSLYGLDHRYDNIHPNQIEWYEQEVKRLDRINMARGGGPIMSSVYFHIPLREYLDAWTEYVDEGNTEDVSYIYGWADEPEPIVFCGEGEDELFETVLALDRSKYIFVGHDHLNYFSLEYKGIRLTYGMSIDYLSYIGIDRKTKQRGGTQMVITEDGTLDITQVRLEE